MAWRVKDGLFSWWAAYRTEDEALEAVGLREEELKPGESD
jgi:hypothetical protein